MRTNPNPTADQCFAWAGLQGNGTDTRDRTTDAEHTVPAVGAGSPERTRSTASPTTVDRGFGLIPNLVETMGQWGNARDAARTKYAKVASKA